MMTAIPKNNEKLSIYAEWDGILVEVRLSTNQRWSCNKRGNYYFLRKKNGTFTIRLTQRGFEQHFRFEESGGEQK